jgi:hypothetical protein
VKGTKPQTSKKEGRESKNPDKTGRQNKYWTEGEERRCRMCYEKRETIEHKCNGYSEMRKREKGTRKNTK